MKRTLNHIIKFVAVALIALTATSCSLLLSLANFELQDAKILSFDLSKGAKVEMTIRNKSLFKVTVVGGELIADMEGEPIGEVYMKSPVVLPRRATTTVVVNVGMRFASPLAALRALGTLTSSPDKLTISGYGEGKVWCFTKRYERRNVPISKFISIFGEPSKYLENK